MARFLHKAYIAALVCGLVFLAFIYGAVSTIFNLAPVPDIRIHAVNAYGHLSHLYESLAGTRNQFTSSMWFEDAGAPSGAIVHDAAAMQPGLTLVSRNTTAAVLMDSFGNIVHQWRYDFSAVFDEDDFAVFPQQPDMLHWHRTHLYPNGDLLANHDYVNHYPYGYGLVRIDRSSQVIWKYTGTAHHDFDLDDQGNIHTLVQEIGTAPIGKIQPPYIEDFAVVVDAQTGKEMRRFSVFQALQNSPYRRVFDRWRTNRHGEVTHTNAIRLLPPEWAAAARIPRAKAGDLLISLRNPGALIIVDPVEQRVIWYGEGIWKRQHDPDPLPNGRVLLFDNQGVRGPFGQSRVLEIDLFTHEVYWDYKGTGPGQIFDSGIRGAQQRLPNGNTLITESQRGRLIEVTPAGDIAWEYYNPDRAEYRGKRLRGMMTQARRIPRDALSFLDN